MCDRFLLGAGSELLCDRISPMTDSHVIFPPFDCQAPLLQNEATVNPGCLPYACGPMRTIAKELTRLICHIDNAVPDAR